MGTVDEIEGSTRTVGQELYAAIQGVPPAFDTGHWTGRLLARAMKSVDFKTSLFRFIDVLPSLKSEELVVRLLQEYFANEPAMPEIVRRGLGLLPGKGLFSRIAGSAVRKAVAAVARQFIAGSDPRQLIRTLRSLRGGGTGFTLDLLGEVVVSDREAQAFAERYLELLDLLHASFPDDAEASVKISSFYSQLDPVDWEGSVARTREGLRPLLRKAKDLGVAITLDMEHYQYKALTLAVFTGLLEEEEFREQPRMGLALQAYLKDTEADVQTLIRWARERNRTIGVRLVKGAYWDHEVVLNRQLGWPVPVFLNKQQTDRNFELLTRMLLENADLVRPAIASHNLRSIAHAIAVARSLGVDREHFEFQMLYGMAEPLRKAVQEKQFKVRVYIPVGELVPGMAYLVRRLLENTSNTSFLRRSFSEAASFDEMINKPVPPVQEAQLQPASIDGFTNEPLLDFSIGANRKGMADAVGAIRKGVGSVFPLIIGAGLVRAGQETASRNPARPDEVVGYVSSASRTECDAAITEALRTAVSGNAHCPISELSTCSRLPRR